MNKRDVGAVYERTALFYLEQKGYRIVETNFRCRAGEIDMIARDGEYLVFVEVKYRSTGRKAVIRKVAQYYLMVRRLGDSLPCRFDVVGIDEEEVTIIKDAF